MTFSSSSLGPTFMCLITRFLEYEPHLSTQRMPAQPSSSASRKVHHCWKETERMGRVKLLPQVLWVHRDRLKRTAEKNERLRFLTWTNISTLWFLPTYTCPYCSLQLTSHSCGINPVSLQTTDKAWPSAQESNSWAKATLSHGKALYLALRANFKTRPDFQHKVQAHGKLQFRKHHPWNEVGNR